MLIVWYWFILSCLHRGIAKILHWGTTEAERRRRENRGWDLEGTHWEGVSLPQLTREFVGALRVPQRGPGRSRQRIFGIFEAHRTLLVERTTGPTSQQSHSMDDWGTWLPCLPAIML